MKKNKVRIIQGILLLIFAVCAGILTYEMVIVPKQNQEMTKQLKNKFPENDPVSSGNTSLEEPATKEEKSPAGEKGGVSSVHFPALQAAYPEVKGWITIPDTDIDYPVLQSKEEEPEYYLKRNYRGEPDENGSLFLQWNCDVLQSQNLVIYGHHMNSGVMFGNLDRYTDPAYCRMYPDIFFRSVEDLEIYQIVAVLKVDTSMFPFQQVTFSELDSLDTYVEQARAQSLFETGTHTGKAKKVLTLVTCSYEWEEARIVIVATNS